MLAAAPAFLDRLDRGTPSVRRCELLAKHTRTADAEAVVRDVKAGIEAALVGGRFTDPLLTLHLRRLLRLVVNDAALPALNAEAASHAAARSSGLSSAAAAAAAPSVEAAIVSCIAALGAEKCTSPPLAGVLGHFPLLLPCIRLLTLLYDRYASARIIARDRNVPGTIAELNRRYEAIPPSVSSAAIELMATMSQWIPRRHSPRRRRAEAEDAAARAADGGGGGEGGASLDFAGSRRRLDNDSPARALARAYASPLASPSALASPSPTSRRPLGIASPRGDGSLAVDGADTARSSGRGGGQGLVLSPIRANFKGLPPPLAGALSPTSPSPLHGSGSPRLGAVAGAAASAAAGARGGRLPAHSPLRLRPLAGASASGSVGSLDASSASLGDGYFDDHHDGHGHDTGRSGGGNTHRSAEAAAFAAAEERAAAAFGEEKFIATMTARFGGGLVGAQRSPLPRSFPIDAPPRPPPPPAGAEHSDGFADGPDQHHYHHDATSFEDHGGVGGAAEYGGDEHSKPQQQQQQQQQHYEAANIGYGAPAAGPRGMRGRGLLGGGADSSGPL